MALLEKYFWRNLLLLVGLILLLLLVFFQGLKIYTHHGEQLTLPNYLEKSLDLARSDASENSFRIEVTDSVFIVGKAGGIIVNQNPDPGSTVKRNRKIYVVVTKGDADMVSVRSLPRMYGERYDRKKRELKKAFEIESTVEDHVYDKGMPEMIMEVKYKGEIIANKDGRKDDVEIPKGATLNFILSKSDGGKSEIVDLSCLSYKEAKFLIDAEYFVLGDRSTDGSVADLDAAYVLEQDPPYSEGARYDHGTAISLILTKEKPSNCE